ncbi:hypothetical protein ACFE04_026462 [Oxalis oulophora]
MRPSRPPPRPCLSPELGALLNPLLTSPGARIIQFKVARNVPRYFNIIKFDTTTGGVQRNFNHSTKRKARDDDDDNSGQFDALNEHRHKIGKKCSALHQLL